MNKSVIFSLILFCAFSNVKSQKIKIKTLEDSLKYIISTYNFYVSDLSYRRPSIEVMALPEPIFESNNLTYKNRFYSEDQAIELFANNRDALDKLIGIIEQKKQDINKKLRKETELNYFTGPRYNIPAKTINNFRFFFIDPRNLPSSRGRNYEAYLGTLERFRRKIRDSIYGIPANIESLVFSENYKSSDPNSEAVPIFLKFLLSQSMSKSLECLTERELSVVRDTKIYYTNPRRDKTILWVSIDSDSIFISPRLIRATFFFTLNEYYLFKPLFQEFNKIEWERKNVFGPSAESEFIRFNNPEAQKGIRTFYSKFIDNFTFVISHELAHSYSQEIVGNLLSEIRCDCQALNRIKKKYANFTLGIYKSIFQASISRQLNEIWGVKNLKDMLVRFNYMEKFSTEFKDCESISLESILTINPSTN